MRCHRLFGSSKNSPGILLASFQCVNSSSATVSMLLQAMSRRQLRNQALDARPRWLLTGCLLHWQLHVAQELADAAMYKHASQHR